LALVAALTVLPAAAALVDVAPADDVALADEVVGLVFPVEVFDELPHAASTIANPARALNSPV
jgi:hypothetical protein